MSSIISYDDRSKFDPALLSDECLIQIFSFVWGGKDSDCSDQTASVATSSSPSKSKTVIEVSAREVFAYYCQLSTLSCAWKKMLGEVLGHCVPSLSVDFDEVPESHLVEFAVFLCAGKFSIKALACPFPRDFLAASKVLEECETASLDTMSVALALPPLWTTTTSTSAASMQREFLDQGARQCPNLVSLKLILHLEDQSLCGQDITSSLLFEHPVLEHLTVHLTCSKEARVEIGCNHKGGIHCDFLFSGMTRNLPCLRTLTLESSGEFAPPTTILFYIETKSLQVLRVDKLFDGPWQTTSLFALKCPQLCQFYNKAHTVIHRPGSNPVLSVVQSIYRGSMKSTVAEECEVFLQVESELEGWNVRITRGWQNFLAWVQ